MESGLLDENKNAEKEATLDTTDPEIIDPQYMCGWRGFKPKWLQCFNSPNWFIVFISVFSCCQGLLVNGLTSLVIPEIEKEFGFSSKESGVILASNDASGIILVGVVSYFGAHGHKPKWIGYGSIVTGIGSLLFALPKVMIGKYSPADLMIKPLSRGLCLTKLNATSALPSCQDVGVDHSALSLMVFSIAQLIMGAGTAPLFTLGPAFLDENVNPKKSPIYLGIWFSTTFFGPGLGYMVGGMFLSKYTDIKLPDGMNLTPKDPRWIGAWWLGYFLLSWILIIVGVVILGYPKILVKTRRKREEALKRGDLPGADETLKKGWRGMLPSLIQLLKNKTLMFAIFALTIKTLYGVAIGSFFAKIIKVKFDADSTAIGLALGLVLVPGMGGGIMTGAFIMKKVKIKNSAKIGALLCTIFGFLTVAFSVSWLLPGCDNAVFGGLESPYYNETLASGLVAQCNAHCSCSEKLFNPVCAPDGTTFFSSCHAGCKNKQKKGDTFVYSNCTCVSPLRGNSTGSNSVRQGFCDRGCKNLYIFLGLIGAIIVLVFVSATPHKMVVLRSVPDNQRSFALGIQFIVMRSLSFIPGPIIFGSMIDAYCTVWLRDSCGKRLNCASYEIHNLSSRIVIFGCTTSVIASFFYLLSYWFYKPLESSDQQVSQKRLLEEENAELTKAPSIQKLSAV